MTNRAGKDKFMHKLWLHLRNFLRNSPSKAPPIQDDLIYFEKFAEFDNVRCPTLKFVAGSVKGGLAKASLVNGNNSMPLGDYPVYNIVPPRIGTHISMD